MATNTKSKSPLRDKPLRQAGQSVQEEIDRLLDEQALPYVLGSIFVVMLAAIEWYRWWTDSPLQPGIATFTAAIVVAFTAFKLRGVAKRAQHLRQGRDGEKIVGEFLEELREKGCIVFHDIVADKFNIDHVVLSDRGIFVVETKTFSKPGGDAKVRSDGKGLSCDGLGDQTHIIDQAKGNARWIAEMLKQSTGRDFATKPVIVFPGWYVEGGLHKDHWVISPKALPKLLEGEDQRIRPEDVKMAAYHLSRYIRATP